MCIKNFFSKYFTVVKVPLQDDGEVTEDGTIGRFVIEKCGNLLYVSMLSYQFESKIDLIGISY